MQEKKGILVGGVIALGVLALIFYWFQIRPSQTRKICKKVYDQKLADLKDFNTMFEHTEEYRTALMVQGTFLRLLE